VKYYCKKCNAEIRLLTEGDKAQKDENGNVECRLCGDGIFADAPPEIMSIIPDYETPAQYEKRTGKAYPHNAPVWWKYAGGNKKWRTQSYSYAKRQSTVNNILIVIADSPVPPPVGWKPED